MRCCACMLGGWVLWAALLPQWVLASEPVRIGVLAYRPKPVTLAQWQPLAALLKERIPERDFVVEAFTLPELEAAVASRQLDFVLTNSANHVLLNRQSGLQAPLATLLMSENGHETAAFGGVIFTRADRKLATLADLRGKRVATAGVNSLGGYQMQAYELLQMGIDLAREARVLETGMPQDRAVHAVLEGSADVGLVRTGLLESMAREGSIDLSQISVLNRQNLRDYPVMSSTVLYPEWPFSYLAHVDERLARQVVAALLQIQPNSMSALTMGIRGFSVPADYASIERLLKALRLPPFEAAPAFTWRDVLARYWLALALATLAMLLISGLSLRLWLTSRQLRLRQQQVLAQQAALAESEFRCKFAVEASGGGLWDWDLQADTLYLADSWKLSLGYGAQELTDLSTRQWESRLHPQDAPQALAALKQCTEGNQDYYRSENRLRCKDGSYKWMLELGRVVGRDASGRPLRIIGMDLDIHARKESEQQLALAATVFTHAREAIIITDAQCNMLEVNQAFSQISGYSRAEALGQNPRLLRSNRQDSAFYAAMYAQLHQHGYWSGELWNQHKQGTPYAVALALSLVRDAQGAPKNYVGMLTDITSLKEHQRQLERVVHFDALTGLPNRLLLVDRLQQAMVQALRRRQMLAVAYLDIDGFKAVNDTWGQDAGDQLLVALAAAMRRCLREGDTLARLGSDEFVAVLVDLPDQASADHPLAQLLAAAAQPFDYGEARLSVSASLGVSYFPQTEALDADQLLRQADQAMYQAKLGGKNRLHVFDAEQDRSVRGLHENIETLARAIDRGELRLHYQPKVNLRSGEVIGLEALVRWQHPQRGLLGPALFLPMIEDHALAVTLGDWVIGTALAQLQSWQAQGLLLQVSVNVGARQLQQDDFVPRLAEALARCPELSAQQLEIEVLETSALQDLERTAHIMRDCARLGVGFALDDFGTGYSSLTYLKHLPVGLIKIDQSFVRDMLDDSDDLAILEGIIGLARAFRRQVIAEGVETPAHGARLLQLGCELAQGYGIARPMPPEQVPTWVRDWLDRRVEGAHLRQP